MPNVDERLSAIAAQLTKGVAPQSESVRSFLLWFGASRRGFRVVRGIRHTLGRHGLTTEPDFEGAYIDGLLKFTKAPKPATGETGVADDSAPDPTFRIGRLDSANRAPISVTPDATLQQIVTLLLANDFSQLPVMSGARELKGVVSWRTLGSRLALNRPCTTARECIEPGPVLPVSESLFAAIETIAQYDYVLVQAPDKRICGIVTASDLNEQFRLLAEPFLLVGEIENGVRRLLHGKFSLNQLEEAKFPGDDTRTITTPADLTFGEYVRLIENDARWKLLRIELDRVEFVRQLNRVKDIRNDVMHFDSDGLDDEDVIFLRDFASFLKRLREVGAV